MTTKGYTYYSVAFIVVIAAFAFALVIVEDELSTDLDTVKEPLASVQTPDTFSVPIESENNKELSANGEYLYDKSDSGELDGETAVKLNEEWRPITDAECFAHLAASPFYLDPQANVIREEELYRSQEDFETADFLREISCFPQAVWLTRADALYMKARTSEISRAAEVTGKIPVFVIFNAPDHGSVKWWVGNQGVDYMNWIKAVAEGVGSRTAWFILEPDAIGLATHYSPADQAYRLKELNQAVETLKKYASNSRVYLDGGHSKWKTPEIYSPLLIKAGLSKADGFVLNISNYQLLENELERGRAITTLTDGKHFIVDTSRNGKGGPYDNEWCNARGRALGKRPTMDTGELVVDAFLWVKPPGESDGVCNNGKMAGTFWIEYALELIENALTF